MSDLYVTKIIDKNGNDKIKTLQFIKVAVNLFDEMRGIKILLSDGSMNDLVDIIPLLNAMKIAGCYSLGAYVIFVLDKLDIELYRHTDYIKGAIKWLPPTRGTSYAIYDDSYFVLSRMHGVDNVLHDFSISQDGLIYRLGGVEIKFKESARVLLSKLLLTQ